MDKEEKSILSDIKLHYGEIQTLLYPLILAIILVKVRSLCRQYVFIYIHKFFSDINRAPLDNELGTVANNGQPVTLNREGTDGNNENVLWTEKFKRQLKDFVDTDNLTKFTDNCWEMASNAWVFLLSLSILFPKTWFWHIVKSYDQYKDQTITNDLSFYYLSSLTIYYVWFATHLPKRNNVIQVLLFLYNILNMGILNMFWTINLTRIGSIIIFTTFPVDLHIDMSTLMFYSTWYKWPKLKLLYVICGLAWTIFRTVVYPIVNMIITLDNAPLIFHNDPDLENLKYTFHIYAIMQIVRCLIILFATALTCMMQQIQMPAGLQ